MVENSNQYGNPEIGLFFTIKLLLRWALWPNGPLFDRHCKYFVDSTWVFAPVFMILFFDNVVPFFFTSTKSNATAEYFVIAKKTTRSAFDNWFQIWIHVYCEFKGCHVCWSWSLFIWKKNGENAEHWLFIYSLKFIKYFHSFILDYKKRFISAARKCNIPVS